MKNLSSKCCPICDSKMITYGFVIENKMINRCEECLHLFSDNSVQEQCFGLEFSDNPQRDLIEIHSKLAPGTPYSFRISIMDHKSITRNTKNFLQFFNTKTIHNLLCKCGFEHIEIIKDNNGEAIINCISGIIREKRVISIIVPVYNEENTIAVLLNNLYSKELEGVDKEIIIVESNSIDETRQIVEDFVAKHPDIKLVLEEKPKGKGHAVRSGFKVATGDFIAIQDGDLEYDINDYDKLVKPLVNYQRAFVLGSRHTGDWKMRDFGAGRKFIAYIMNLGQVLCTALINIGCGVRLKDPFTMYKLFRRECLYGLKFDGNRFEIDWEIVIKLIRKGFIPYEIPVNYVSRGFDDGKKVSMIRDPLIWIKCFIKYRYFYKIEKRYRN